MSQYNINPVSRGVNNFFEGLTNSTNPQYIQPVSTPQYTAPPQPVYPVYSTPIPTSYTPISSGPLPTVTYTPGTLRSSFKPLNSNYNSSYYGTR